MPRTIIIPLVFLLAWVGSQDLFAQEEAPKQQVCQHLAPEPGDLLVCDSGCNCQTLGPKKADPKSKQDKETKPPACGILLNHIVAPIYPQIAKNNRIFGTVFIQVEVEDGGGVKSARVIEGHPMLNQAAVDAVKLWQFNDQCNHVQMVSVRFRPTENPSTDPPGVTFNPPDDVEIVGDVVTIDQSTSTISRKAKSKGTAIPKPKSK